LRHNKGRGGKGAMKSLVATAFILLTGCGTSSDRVSGVEFVHNNLSIPVTTEDLRFVILATQESVSRFHVIPGIKDTASKEGLIVFFGMKEEIGSYGVYHPDTKTIEIAVDPDTDDASICEAVLYELGHELLHFVGHTNLGLTLEQGQSHDSDLFLMDAYRDGYPTSNTAEYHLWRSIQQYCSGK
jgi:hypothetical protein